MKNPEKRGYLVENCHRVGLNPPTNTTFDWFEAEDSASFSRKFWATLLKQIATKSKLTTEEEIYETTRHQNREKPQNSCFPNRPQS